MATFEQLMADMTVIYETSRNSSSTAQLKITTDNVTTQGTYYYFALCGGYMDICKIERTSSGWENNQVLWQVSADDPAAFANATNIFATWGGSTSIRGGSLIMVNFPNYTETDVDAVFSSLSLISNNGRNSSAAAAVSLALPSADTYVFAAFRYTANRNPASVFGISKSTGSALTNLFGIYDTNPSGLYLNGSTMYLSYNGTASRSVYGGSIVCVQSISLTPVITSVVITPNPANINQSINITVEATEI